MKLTDKEKLMYSVMEAIYESGTPIDFKGSMVLKACLIEQGYNEEIRHTVDIDANWYSTNFPTAEQMAESLQNALSRKGIDLSVNVYRMYGENRSAGFELKQATTDEILFTMDVDVNRPKQPMKIYNIRNLKFSGITPTQMLADKVSAISTDKVFRRIKDVIDLYYLSRVIEFDEEAVINAMRDSGRVLSSFDGFLHRTDDLKHAFDKFKFAGYVVKPQFEVVYTTVKSYIPKSILFEQNIKKSQTKNRSSINDLLAHGTQEAERRNAAIDVRRDSTHNHTGRDDR